MDTLCGELRSCRLCEERFRNTETGHTPRPVVWLSCSAPVLIIGQAPGARVHKSGIPFDDPSGDRLRAWLGVDRDAFYDRSLFAIMPMAFCFPGYDRKGSDLPPPPICARTWHDRALAHMKSLRLTLLVGGHAQRYHLRQRGASSVTATVSDWRQLGPDVIPLPHPSWRNTAWLKKNLWFAEELLPFLRARIIETIGSPADAAHTA